MGNRVAAPLPAAMLVTLMFASISPAEQPPIRIRTLEKGVTTSGNPIYRVVYSYEFTAFKRVYVDSIGIVPAKGEFAYLTNDPTILVHDAGYTKVLLKFTPATFTQVANRIPLPDESAFGEQGIEELWPYSSSFQQIASSILNQMGFEYTPYQRQSIQYIRTTYAQIYPPASKVRAEFALLLSHPHNPRNNEFYFRIQKTMLEGRIKDSKLTEQVSEQTRQIATQRVQALLTDILSKGRTSK